jgi:hypothetical protein
MLTTNHIGEIIENYRIDYYNYIYHFITRTDHGIIITSIPQNYYLGKTIYNI